MSRLVLILGIILMIVGAVGLVFGVITVPQQFINTLSQAKNPNAALLCKPGESLATEQGPEEYDSIQHLYNRDTTFYCVNNEGIQRDVTQQFANGFVQNLFGTFGSVIIPVISFVLCTFGFVLTIFGGIFFMRRRVVSSIVGSQFAPVTGQTSPVMRQNPSLSNRVLDAKLREIEEARRNSLITEDEYQKMRKDALDSLS